MNHHDSIVEYDPVFDDMVWKSVFWILVTIDIDMNAILMNGRNPFSSTFHLLSLPSPNPEIFIPHKDVTEITVLGWIHSNVPNMVELQKRNTEFLKMKLLGKQNPLDMSH